MSIKELNKTKLLTVNQFVIKHPFATHSGLRFTIFNAKTNGFDRIIRQIGRHVLIKENLFFQWVEKRTIKTRGLQTSNNLNSNRKPVIVKVCRPSNDNSKEIVFKLCRQQAKTLIALIEAKEKRITFLSISLWALRLVAYYILRIGIVLIF